MDIRLLVIVASVSFPAHALAQITPVGPFVGDAAEGFETQPAQADVHCIQPRILGGRADLCTMQGSTLGVAAGFTFFGSITSHGGAQCAGSGISGAVFLFDAPVQRFGGWFGTTTGASDGNAVFYDATGALIGVQTISAAACTQNCGWTWNGWDAGAGPRFASIWVNSATGTGAGLAFDDLEAQFGAPQTGVFYCNGDGSTHACPCANESTEPPRGCLNSHDLGARLTAGGAPSLSGDSVVLYASDMGPTATHLFFQGLTPGAGTGQLWGDGLLCVGSTIVRLARHAASDGLSQYPESGELPVSVRGAVASPGVRHYQVWYRDVSPLCLPDRPFNMTNAYRITWVP